jgi:hypothetical protein
MRGIDVFVIALTLGVAGCGVDGGNHPASGITSLASLSEQRDDPEIDRYDADITIVTETDNTRRFHVPAGHGARVHLARFRDDGGNWWTSIEMPSRGNPRRPRARTARVVTRVEMRDGGGLVRTWYANGEFAGENTPSRPPGEVPGGGELGKLAARAKDMPAPALGALSFDALVVTPGSAARLRARLEKVARTLASADARSHRLLVEKGDKSLELVLDAATGAVTEEITRARGNVVQHATHEYKRGPQGLLVRSRTRLHRGAAEGRGPIAIETIFENTRVRARGVSDA